MNKKQNNIKVEQEKINIQKNEELMLIIKQFSNLCNGKMNDYFKDDKTFSKGIEKTIIQILAILKTEHFIEINK